MSFQEVNTNVNFPKEEEQVLQSWKQDRIFEKSIEQRPQDKLYSFYDGPPFATGLPHYGHLVAGIIKDIIPRYWTMKGFRVERRFGWDCHGLPVEYEIDKKLDIHGRKGVEQFGIANYNRECRSIVQRYTAEWRHTVERIGRWVDFDDDYKTMDPEFMESVWWVFKQLWEKDLIYEGFKVLPYSTAVATPLSNFEASSNYRELQDPSITVTFRAKDEENTSFLAWTTTPWTLPSNLGLCVGPELNYVKIRSKKHDDQLFILGENRLKEYFKKKNDYEVVEKFPGKELEGREYLPLFDYFADRSEQGAFRVLVADYVSDADGTGIVHTAAAFGEDDFYVCQRYGIEPVIPVDDDGEFTEAVSDFVGKHVKEADKDIIANLKQRGLLFKQATINHSVPFCWRSDTPLIYKAVSTWFVKVEQFRDKISANNQKTHWVPEHVRDGRFSNWLENARDWAISRNRFWGNPIPLWRNDETGEIICVGSIAELNELTGKKTTDIHRENLDDLVIPDKNGKGEFRRVPEVLDCWFESGAMPYAQAHYPFENKEVFERGFPADFIAEGLDQTRGWFYTLSVLGTALFDSIPFKNVIVNGMILAEDGKKMSKRLKNYPAPDYILDEHGADALRLYMIQSPAVRAEELRFSEVGVKDVVRRILLKWWNAYSFFVNYAVIDKWKPKKRNPKKAKNILDRWILSRLQSLLTRVEEEMARYRLYNVVPALIDFIEDLTNTYIRFNRKRFWDEQNTPDKHEAYRTLYEVLYTFAKAMAPFTPFLAEMTYKNLSTVRQGEESVHLCDYPLANKSLIEPKLEKSVAVLQQVIVMARNLREQAKVKVKIPLKAMTIVHHDQQVLDELKVLEGYMVEELNIRTIEYSTDEASYVELTARANGAVLGPKLGKNFGKVAKAIGGLSSKQLFALEHGESLTLEGEEITANEVSLQRKPRPGHENLASNTEITVEIDASVDEDQKMEGLAREVVNRIQKLRKAADLKLDNRITVQYQGDAELEQSITAHRDYIAEQILATEMVAKKSPKGTSCEKYDIDKKKITIALTVAE